MRVKPYFMKDKKWYYHDPEEHKYKLTEYATEEARKSYEEFYEERYEYVEENGEIVTRIIT